MNAYTGEKLILDFRRQPFRHAERLSFAYHDTMGTSDSVYRILWDAEPVRYVAIDSVTPFITATFTLVSMLEDHYSSILNSAGLPRQVNISLLANVATVWHRQGSIISSRVMLMMHTWKM